MICHYWRCVRARVMILRIITMIPSKTKSTALLANRAWLCTH